MESRTLRRRALHDEVRDLLAERIAAGTYAPGERLVETRIARDLGVSQGVVREALRALDAIGLIETAPFRGAVVRRPTEIDRAEARELLGLVEGYATRRALEVGGLATPGLELLVDRMVASEASGDGAALELLAREFHRSIVQAAGSSLLVGYWETLAALVGDPREASPTPAVDGGRIGPTGVADAHGAIVDALRAGDPATVERIAREHAARPAS